MKWFLPTLILGCILMLGLFVVGLFAIIHSVFVSSQPYRIALTRASSSGEVAAKIGTPMQVGWWIMGNFNASGPTGNASFDIPISGPKGKGRIVVIAKEQSNQWTFDTLEVDIEGEDSPIHLDAPAPNPPAEIPNKPN
jgi:Cytochrome oxidase complex assembly protein 1